MAFKLGKEGRNKRREDIKIPGSPIQRKKLGQGILGEANDDGSVYLSNKLKPGSQEEKDVLAHELKHITDMKVGKLSYGNDFIKYNGVTYPRRDGFIKFEGRWMPEGSDDFPWEGH